MDGETDHWLEIDGQQIPLTVRANPRARRLIVKVEPSNGRVVVVAPNKRSFPAALKFAATQKGWIAARLGELPKLIPFESGVQFPLRGETCFIDHRPRARNGVWLEADLGGLRVCVSGEAAHLHRRLTHYLRREARKDLVERVAFYTGKLDVPMPRITVRDTATRWGSCSARTGLSFSWRLIFAPPTILDYVAAHEVAHLKHMNHSKTFWRLVDKLYGDPSQANRWLNNEGPGLHRYGRKNLLNI